MQRLPRWLLLSLPMVGLLLGAPPSARAQAQAPTPAPPAAPGSECLLDPASQEKYCPGWRVQVFSVQKDRQSRVGRFVAKQASRITMRDHLTTIDFDSPSAIYKGEAFFNAPKDGEYSFLVEVRRGRNDDCDLALLAGNDILVQTDEATPVAGAKALQAGLHRLEFTFSCAMSDRANAPPVLVMKLLAEGEDAPREFRANEIYYKGS